MENVIVNPFVLHNFNVFLRYVKQTSNRKGIEKTFARKECQREYLQIWRLRDKGLRAATTEKSGKYSREKVLFKCHNSIT